MKRKAAALLLTFAICCCWHSPYGAFTANAMPIDEAVRLAVNNHPTGQAQRASQRAAVYDLSESRGALLPQIRLYGDAGKERVENPASLTPEDNGAWHFTREIGVAADLVIFDGFERANAVYRNAARADAAIYRLLATSETLALNAVEAYVDVVRHRQLLEIARRNIARHREILEQISAMVAGGNAPESDRFQIEERVFAAEAVAIDIEKAYQEAEAKFRKIVGVVPTGAMAVVMPSGIPVSSDQLISQAIVNNYEILAAEKVIRESEYRIEENRSAYLPKVFLEGRASAGEDRAGSSGYENDLYVGLRLSWQVYDGGSDFYRTQSSYERRNEAEFRRDAKVRDVRELAERAWIAYVNGRERNAKLLAQVDSNRRVVSNYLEEFQLAKRTLLDVLDAERALFNSQFQQISVAAAYRYAGYRILAAASRLASYFGIEAQDLAPVPVIEERTISDPLGIFNVTIEPLE
jgi:outer membrane protein, adhesin transport system